MGLQQILSIQMAFFEKKILCDNPARKWLEFWKFLHSGWFWFIPFPCDVAFKLADAIAQKANALQTLQQQNVDSKLLDNMIEVKLRIVELLMKLHLTATGCHLPYGITQCYLPSDTSDVS